MKTNIYYINKLKERFHDKQRENAQYSLRAFSRDLNLHSATLSQILSGRRSLPLKRALEIATKLSLSPKEKTLFMESFYRNKTDIDAIQVSPLDERFILDESYHQIIAEWEHYATLELFNLKNPDLSIDGISQKLGISKTRTELVLNNLLNCKLIIKNEKSNSFSKAYSDVRTTEDVKSNALKLSHKETLKMGLEKLEEIDIELRDFSSSTLAIDLNKLLEAKTIIREFRQKMTALLDEGQKTEVYQLAIQFYPLSKIKKTKGETK